MTSGVFEQSTTRHAKSPRKDILCASRLCALCRAPTLKMPNPDQRHWAPVTERKKTFGWSRYWHVSSSSPHHLTLVPIILGTVPKHADLCIRNTMLSLTLRGHHGSYFSFRIWARHYVLYDIDRTSGGKLFDQSKFEYIRRYDV